MYLHNNPNTSFSADARATAIIDWLTHTLDLVITHFEVASSDASFRRYFRVTHSQGQHIVMDAPPEQENTEPFIRIATLFKATGLNVPQIYQHDLQQGFILLEDFGTRCFLDQLNQQNATELYQTAFISLQQLQSCPNLCNSSLPHYNVALLDKELEIFYDWFLSQHLNLAIPQPIKQNFNQILINSALEQPQACTHRDFHSRNLMFLSENSPGIIDFQDAVVGPITYDLVSLLRDCYVAWPEKNITLWLTEYYQQISDLGLINTDLVTFTRWFDLMGLQRHLKAIGIFSRLNIRDNKSSYLTDIPRTLLYIRHVCNKYPELDTFNHFLLNTLLPAYNNKK